MSSDSFQLNDAQTWLQRGQDFGSQGHYENAIEAFSRAIALNPGSIEAYQDRGMTYYHLKQYRVALNDLNHAVALGATFFAYPLRGDVFLALGEFKSAVADFTRFIDALEQRIQDQRDRRGMSVQPLVRRGAAYLGMKDLRRAFSDFDRAVEYSEYLSQSASYIRREAYFWRGNAYVAQKKLREALADYDKGLSVSVDVYETATRQRVEEVERELRAKRQEVASRLGVD